MYTENVMVKFSPEQLRRVRAAVEREGFCPLAVYIRQVLLSRAAQVLGPQEEAGEP